eukprot:gene14118-biopygen11130
MRKVASGRKPGKRAGEAAAGGNPKKAHPNPERPAVAAAAAPAPKRRRAPQSPKRCTAFSSGGSRRRSETGCSVLLLHPFCANIAGCQLHARRMLRVASRELIMGSIQIASVPHAPVVDVRAAYPEDVQSTYYTQHNDEIGSR